jgi:hypothetical protein
LPLAIFVSDMQCPPERTSRVDPEETGEYQPQQMLTTGRPHVPFVSREVSQPPVGAQVSVKTNCVIVKQSAGRFADIPACHPVAVVPALAPEGTVLMATPMLAIVFVTLSYWLLVIRSDHCQSGIEASV